LMLMLIYGATMLPFYLAESINQSINLYFAQICKNNDNSCTKYTVSRTARLTMALTAALNNTNTNDTVDFKPKHM